MPKGQIAARALRLRPGYPRGCSGRLGSNRQANADTALDHLVVDSLADCAIVVLDRGGCIVRWNLGARALFGYDDGEVIGRHHRLLSAQDDVADDGDDAELDDASGGSTTRRDRWHVRKSRERFWGWSSVHPLYDGRRRLLGFTRIVRDLTEQYHALEALRDNERRLHDLVEQARHAARHDDLTGLANRTLFRESLQRATARLRPDRQRSFAVLFLDLDGFKTANDRLGHLLADRLLVGVARRLERAVRSGDVVARFGGDEFAILVDDIRGSADAVATAEHILESFRESFVVGGVEISMSWSIGISLPRADGRPDSDETGILHDADLAMYEAKARGRSRFVLSEM